MTGRPPGVHPHLWVPYNTADPPVDLCTLCGTFQTPENSEEDCPEQFSDDEPARVPEASAIDVLDTADGADDEQQRGVTKPS